MGRMWQDKVFLWQTNFWIIENWILLERFEIYYGDGPQSPIISLLLLFWQHFVNIFTHTLFSFHWNFFQNFQGSETFGVSTWCYPLFHSFEIQMQVMKVKLKKISLPYEIVCNESRYCNTGEWAGLVFIFEEFTLYFLAVRVTFLVWNTNGRLEYAHLKWTLWDRWVGPHSSSLITSEDWAVLGESGKHQMTVVAAEASGKQADM